VRLPDANVLIYAIDETSARHTAARTWLESALSGREPIGFAWVVLLAFLRLTTRATLFDRPLQSGDAFAIVDGWLAQPCATIVHPTARHADLLRGLLRPVGAAGNLTNDAHLAALSIEYGGVVCSSDSDFSRFPGVAWEDPLRS
jgi:toxin-antitoxin system PIN domain toxin